MASEWARKKAAELLREIYDSIWRGMIGSGHLLSALETSLDTTREEGKAEGREEGAQRERWECRELAETVTDDHRLPYTECPRCGSHIADAIAARGPMRGPEEA